MKLESATRRTGVSAMPLASEGCCAAGRRWRIGLAAITPLILDVLPDVSSPVIQPIIVRRVAPNRDRPTHFALSPVHSR
jgi:hypothetical protein